MNMTDPNLHYLKKILVKGKEADCGNTGSDTQHTTPSSFHDDYDARTRRTVIVVAATHAKIS